MTANGCVFCLSVLVSALAWLGIRGSQQVRRLHRLNTARRVKRHL